MKVPRKALEQLLSATSREQHINGKPQKQVTGCILVLGDDKLSTTSIVKDGKTSLSYLSFKCEGDEESLPVPDIERMLGVLKYHGDYVTLSLNNGKVLIKSNKKQTTLAGGFDAKAFANSQHTLKEWHNEAKTRAEQIDGLTYKTKDGGTISPFFTAQIEAGELYDALRCDGMNGQKLNRYRFQVKDNTLSVSVGDPFKGQTTTDLGEYTTGDFEVSFEGGLENIARHYRDDIYLRFLDFREHGQGIRLLMVMGNGDWVFQAGVL